jgi:thiol-disulfide isomerase/thioredoxin
MSRAAPRKVADLAAQQRAFAQRRRIVLFVSLALVAIAIVVAVALGSRVPQSASVAPTQAQVSVGQVAPEFAASTTAGPFDLAKNGGKPTLLELFASWCPHCQRETAVLNTLYAKYQGKVNVVAVSASATGAGFDGAGEAGQAPESQADVVDFAQKFNVTYPIAFDPDLDVAKKYLQGGFPTIVVIGADDKVEAIRSGEIPLGDLSAALDAALSGKSPSPTLGGSSS